MRRLILPLLALAALAAPSDASVVVRLDLPALVERADLIVEARCLAVSVERGPRGLPVTRVRLAVDRGWRGAETGQVVEFSLPGGSLGGRRLVLPGLPGFAVGDELVLFLTRPSRDGHRLPVGLGQGRFEVLRDPTTGARSLARALTGLELVDPQSGAPVPAESVATLSYEQLVARLDQLPARPAPSAPATTPSTTETR